MVAHERDITVTEAGQITVSGLPLQPGQRVRVTVSVDPIDRTRNAAEFRRLFKQLRSLPAIRPLSDDEIAREIELHRRSLGAA